MASSKDYYQLLGIAEKRNGQVISSDELRQAYKRALLHYHPDKQDASAKTHDSATATVDEITEAYKVLGDDASRAIYDQELRNAEASNTTVGSTRHTGMETVDLEELDVDEESGIWRRSCRCGSEPAFVVTEAELEKHVEDGELVTGCKGCSLWLKVMFTVED